MPANPKILDKDKQCSLKRCNSHTRCKNLGNIYIGNHVHVWENHYSMFTWEYLDPRVKNSGLHFVISHTDQAEFQRQTIYYLIMLTNPTIE